MSFRVIGGEYMSRERIVIVDDHVVILDAFKRLLEPVYQVVGTVSDGVRAVTEALRLRPDILLMDIGLPKLNGLDACERIKAEAPEVRVICLSMNEDADTAEEAIRRGASGYVLKKSTAAELFEAIRTVLQGRSYVSPALSKGMTALFVTQAQAREQRHDLTMRQREVLQLLAEGRSMKEAADSLQLTPRTVAFHKYSIMEQMGIKSSAELVRYAVELGLVARKTPNIAFA